MILYRLVQNKNANNENSYLKWYPRALVNATVDLDGLAAHMALHNTPYSEGAIKGILTDMVSCIKENLANGYAVKIDDLAIFRVSIVSKKGCENKKDFKASEYIEGVRMRSTATGDLSYSRLNLDITLKRSPLDTDDDDSTTSTVDTEVDTGTGGGDSGGDSGGSGTSDSGGDKSVVDPLA